VIAYELTARPIIAALIDAHRRGVDVEVVLDRTNTRTVGQPAWISGCAD
jgi:phosphatidylserine/phosphatidylglycerophosphate/cardiolipin synthase-like enzyme